MAAISSERPVRIPIVAVTTDRVLVQGLAEEFGAQFAALGTWPDPGVRAAEVLLIDLEVLPRSRWPQLVRRSRHTDRPEIVLIDDQEMPRAILARFAADELIAHDTGLAGIVTIAREHTIAYAFRETAEQIRADPRFPYPLNAFLGAACADQNRSCGRARGRVWIQALNAAESVAGVSTGLVRPSRRRRSSTCQAEGTR